VGVEVDAESTFFGEHSPRDSAFKSSVPLIS
jgi:hypothetical protein